MQRTSLSTLLTLVACSSEPQTDPTPSPAQPTATRPSTQVPEDTGTTAPRTDTADFCDDLPTVDYNNFGRGFMTESCQGCHASSTPERYGAPESVSFDTVEQVWLWQERILARATGEAASMPPSGGITKDDRTLLEWWLRCAEPGT